MDGLVKQGGESPAIVTAHLLQHLVLRDCLVHEDGVEQQQTVVDALQTERRDVLLLATIGGKASLAARAHNVIGFIPALHHVQARFHLMPEFQRGDLLTEGDGLLHLAEFGQGVIGWGRHSGRVKACEDGFRCGCPHVARDRVLHPLIRLLDHAVPTNRTAADAGEVRQGLGHTRGRQGEACILAALQPWHAAHPTQQMTDRKRDLGLARGVHAGFLPPPLRVMAHQALEPGGHCGEGEVPQWRVDAHGLGLHRPGHEDAVPCGARAPCGHAILPPTLKPLAIRRAGVPVAPEGRMAPRQDFLDHCCLRQPEGFPRKRRLPHREPYVKAIALIGVGHPRAPGVGPCGKQVEPQEGPQRVAGADLVGARVGEKTGEVNKAVGFQDDIDQVEPAVALAEEVFEVGEAWGCGWCDQGRDRTPSPVLVGCGRREMDMRSAGEGAVALRQRLGESVA